MGKRNQLYNEIVLCTETWGESKINEKLGSIITTLTKEGEWCKVYDDDNGIYIIQHGHNEDLEYWGGPMLTWLTDEEYEQLESLREISEGENSDPDKKEGNKND